jgi:hypothetical protein
MELWDAKYIVQYDREVVESHHCPAACRERQTITIHDSLQHDDSLHQGISSPLWTATDNSREEEIESSGREREKANT